MDLVGRKKTMIGSNLLSLVGWVVIAAAPSVTIICVGRFLNGLAAAAIALSGKYETKYFFFLFSF
jgi:predicted MFS family arabinose efflux permease